MTLTFTFPGCWVHVDDAGHFLFTVFPDGRELTSVPMESKDRATAQQYGYGDNWLQLWREHDLLHHWVAVQFGQPYSPTIWSECHQESPDALPRWARQQEEDFVAHVHRWLNLGHWHDALWPIAYLNRDVEAMRQEALRLLRYEQFEIRAPDDSIVLAANVVAQNDAIASHS
jgi:hypothetical protein